MKRREWRMPDGEILCQSRAERAIQQYMKEHKWKDTWYAGIFIRRNVEKIEVHMCKGIIFALHFDELNIYRDD